MLQLTSGLRNRASSLVAPKLLGSRVLSSLPCDLGRSEGSRFDISQFRSSLKGSLMLAPLTRGGNLPFRRLCADFGAKFTMSEMAYAKFMSSENAPKRNKELTLARSSLSEENFGLQLGTKSGSEAVAAIEQALLANPRISWVDINCGCPTFEASRRGLGAVMLRNPKKLEKLVRSITGKHVVTDDAKDEGTSAARAQPHTSLPVTVKIRLAADNEELNCFDVVERLADAGAAAVIVHGRTMKQRYSKPADWTTIHQLANKFHQSIPIIGNGDILTWFEAEDRLTGQYGNNTAIAAGNIAALLVGRGALVKPWIFSEYGNKQDWEPTVVERIEIYWRLSTYFKEHCGNDDRGKQKAFHFLPWHFNFFCRYRPLPASRFREIARQLPLMQNSRLVDQILLDNNLLLDPAEKELSQLLLLKTNDAHIAISEALWHSSTSDEAVAALRQLAQNRLADFLILESSSNDDSDRANEWSSRGDPIIVDAIGVSKS